MDYLAKKLNQKEHRELVKLLRAKERYVTKNEFPDTPPIFDDGDEVGVFYHVPTPHHVVGRIMQDDEEGVILKTADGKTIHASPFQLFHLECPDCARLH
ncbi:MAG: hypothetical protein ABL958_12245 [Bdellovibrionia bacterium]